MGFRLVPKWVTLNDLERCNFTKFVCDIVAKQLLGVQNLLLIVYGHINMICAIIQRLSGQNKRRQ